MFRNRVLSRLLPVRPRVTHPPVGPCRCGRAGSPSAVPPNFEDRNIITEKEMLRSTIALLTLEAAIDRPFFFLIPLYCMIFVLRTRRGSAP
jgi:hypothetical protein